MERPEEALIRCANCGRTPRPEENPDDDWRVESDGTGELYLFCPECWQREFGGGRREVRRSGPPVSDDCFDHSTATTFSWVSISSERSTP